MPEARNQAAVSQPDTETSRKRVDYKKRCVLQLAKLEGEEPSNKPTLIRPETEGFGIWLTGLQSRFGPILPHYAPFLPFEMITYILCHCKLEVCNLVLIL